MATKNVIAAIDFEIAKLKQARNLLAGLGSTTPAKQAPRSKPNTRQAVSKKRVLSAATRKRIADGQRKRWAAKKNGR